MTARLPDVMHRAYSVLEIKSLDEEQRIIEGIATTPATDRTEDIVVPTGAKYKLPLPLLYQHNAKQPIGHVISATVTDSGIAVKAQIAKGVVPFIDEAWALIKAGLIRGLSIGFRPLSDPTPIKGTYGLKFDSWEWLELSAVTVPANAEASILSIKSADLEFLPAATGEFAGVKGVRLLIPPGVTGPTKELPVKTTREMITALEATRQAKAAELAEIAKETTQKGETMDAQTGEKFDTLNQEIVQIDKDLKRYHQLDEVQKSAAVAVTAHTGVHMPAAVPAAAAPVPALSGIRVKANLFPGQAFARVAIALKRAKGNWGQAIDIAQHERGWMDTSPDMIMYMKAAVAGADSTTSGWASEIAYATNLANEFIEFLRPLTIVGRIPNLRRVPFNVRMASQTAGSTGYWVGQGKAIPVSKLTTSSTSLGITKVAGLVVVDDEIVKLSSPSIEMMVRDDLAAELAETLDLSFIDPNQGGQTNIQPASLLYGVTPVTPTGTAAANVVADIKTLFSTMISANVNIRNSVLVMDETTALALSLMLTSLGQFQFPTMSNTGGSLLGWPVIVSNAANISGSPQYGHMIVAINPREVFLADEGGVQISISNEAAIEMVDSSSVSSITGTGASVVSMFQTQSEAIKAVQYINWAKRRSSAAAFIQAAAYA